MIEMSKKEEVQCPRCGKTSNIADLHTHIETTDILLRIDWGIRSWEEYEIGCCTNSECTMPLTKDNKKIEYNFNFKANSS